MGPDHVRSRRESPDEREEPYYNSAEPLVPETPDLAKVGEASKTCQACHLWRCGTQTVFGEGAARARVMLIGEQPGDKEDRAGRPFVGAATCTFKE